MRMGHRHNDYFVLIRLIDQAVGESTQSAAPNVLAQRMPSFRKLANPFNCRNHFQKKRVAEAGDLTVVIRNRLVELLLGDFENADVHFVRYFASTSSSGIARISPRR